MRKTNTKELYSTPMALEFGIRMEEGILSISGEGAGLFGAGVDERNADDNESIW